MNIIDFKPEHVSAMRLQPRQLRHVSAVPSGYIAHMASLGPCISGERDGAIIACGGVADTGVGNGFAWALMAEDAGRSFVRLDRCMRRMLDFVDLKRIEATVETDFVEGCRWLELLGFESEGVMRRFGPDGADHYRYARIS